MSALLVAAGVTAASDQHLATAARAGRRVRDPAADRAVRRRDPGRASRARAADQRAEALEREQQAATRLAVAQEQARIARELHDVVSHHVSVMTIQAGAAGKVLDADPEQARGALSAIEASGRETMASCATCSACSPQARPTTCCTPARPGPARRPDRASARPDNRCRHGERRWRCRAGWT